MVFDCRGQIDHMKLGPGEKAYPTEEERTSAVNQILAGVRELERRDEMSVMRCKMRVSEVLHSKNADGTTNQERVKLQAVSGTEGSDNAQWSKWTPFANFEISINNPNAFNQLSAGHEFYVDFTPAEAGKSESAAA
jgi:hypothetical protein